MARTFLFLSFLVYLNAEVQIDQDGVPWMCNVNPEQYEIKPLSSADRLLINKLEQVQVFHRHGARTGSHPIQSFLPNATDLEYDCNITTISSRQYMDNNYFINSSNPLYSLRKLYVEGEQVTEGNCQFRQAVHDLIPQLQANAHHLLDAYIGNDPYHLLNDSDLSDIAKNILAQSEDERLSLQSTDYERTIASLTVIISEFMDSAIKSVNSDASPIFDVNIHDQASDPYHSDDNEVCINQKEYKEWIELVENDAALVNKRANEVIASEYGNKTIASFVAEGGIWTSNKVGKSLLYPYCAKLPLPLTNETFWNTVNLSYEWESAHKTYPNTTYAKDTGRCIDHFNAMPMLSKILSHIDAMTVNGTSNLVIHSVHDSTLELLTHALGIWDGELIIFAEMMTLEIYSKLKGGGYLFRITRKGEFVPYPLCNYNNSELCDLNILLNDSFHDVVPQKEWASDICANLVSECRCGYCKAIQTTEEPDTTCSDESKAFDTGDINLWIGMSIGLVVGLLIMICVVLIQRRIRLRKETVNARYFGMNNY